MTAAYNGDVVVIGGNGTSKSGLLTGIKSVRLYDVTANPNRVRTTAQMFYKRWYPTGTLLPNKKNLIMGGTQKENEGGQNVPYFEIFDPDVEGQPLMKYLIEPTFLKGAGRLFYPFNFVLPTGDLFSHCDGYTRFLQPDYQYRPVPNTPDWPDMTVSTEYPRLGTSAISTLYPPYDKAIVHIFGGAPMNNLCDLRSPEDVVTPASTASYHLTISWTGEGDTLAYSFGNGWELEEMPFPRVTCDSLLLPNGDILILNGVQAGCSGDAKYGIARGNYPAFWPVLYQPDQPSGQRFTLLSATSIARVYHSIAVLTTDGLALVAGCDSCNGGQVISDVPFWTKSRTQRYEYGTELFYPPYALDYGNRPNITSLNSVTDSSVVPELQYGSEITLQWDTASLGYVSLSGVSLVSTSTTTHGFNANQRVVMLETVSQDAQAGTITVKTPPNPNVAPAQVYMIWLLNGKTYSGKAWWIKLVY